MAKNPNIFQRSNDEAPAHDGASDFEDAHSRSREPFDLGRNPRVVVVVGVTDGFEYDQKDDGGALVEGAFEPNAQRQNLYSVLQRKIEKGPLKGAPSFFLKEKQRPLFRGDPLADFPDMSYGPAKDLVAKGTAIRSAHLEKATESALSEARKAQEQFAAKVNKDAPK